MIDFEIYTQKLKEEGWNLEENLANHLKRKGQSLSNAPFIKATLKGEIENKEGPLSGIDPLKHDAIELTIIEGVIERLINKYL